MRRYHITEGARTTANGIVLEGMAGHTINNRNVSHEGDQVYCGTCKTTGIIICVEPRGDDRSGGRKVALSDDLCKCKCNPPPRLIADQFARFHLIDTQPAPTRAREAAPDVAPQPAVVPPRPASATSAPNSYSSAFSKIIESACERNWRFYQQQAQDLVAPDGKLIADPKLRNRIINSAYADLWRVDQRFQWAGLAAFASKQVGCGLLHASESIEKIQAEYEAEQRLRRSARKGFWGLFSASEREKQVKLREFEQRRREYEQANRSNPVPGIDWRQDGASFSTVQQLYRHVYEMMALGNTTLFLDVFPLHAFYKDKGMDGLRTCLRLRRNIYEDSQSPVLWPVGHKKLEFGTNYEEIWLAFEAIDAGNIAESVVHLAWHEQRNILQPAMYSDLKLRALLRTNHISYVTGIPSGVSQAIELTLASQCKPLNDGRTIGFSNNPLADLSDIDQRMAFVLKAAARFDELLHSTERHRIEEAIDDVAFGRGIQ